MCQFFVVYGDLILKSENRHSQEQMNHLQTNHHSTIIYFEILP